jgi:zinc transport system permease protein
VSTNPWPSAKVTVSIKWIGTLLINSLLILPASAARNIARSVRQYHALAVLFSLISCLSGLILSYYFDTAAGATIVLISALIFAGTYVLSRVRGE